MVLKHIGVWSAARIAGILYATLGLIVGTIIALVSLIGGGLASVAQSQDTLPAWFAVVFGLGAIVIFPIFYGVLGLVLAALATSLYNLIARYVGGLELDLQ